jgi:hypothetical protein
MLGGNLSSCPLTCGRPNHHKWADVPKSTSGSVFKKKSHLRGISRFIGVSVSKVKIIQAVSDEA